MIRPLLALLLFSLLALPALPQVPLTGDEGWTWDFTNSDSPRRVVEALLIDRHPPLYFVGLWGWRQGAGESLIALRLPAVWGGLLGAACIYRLGRRLYGEKTALAALLLAVLSDKALVFSTEARHYSLLMLWTSASTWALVMYLHPAGVKPRRGRLLAYTACIIAGLYTHSFMALVLAVQGLYALGMARFWRVMGAWGLGGLAFAPWSLAFVHQFLIQGGLRHDLPFSVEVAERLSREFIGTPLALGVVLLVLGAFAARQGRQSAALPLLGLTLPLAFILLAPRFSAEARFLTDRNLAILLPFLFLLLGRGLASLEPFAYRAFLLFILLHGLSQQDAPESIPPVHELAQTMTAGQVDDQPLVLDVGGMSASLAYHVTQALQPPPPLIRFFSLAPQIASHVDRLTVFRFEELGGTEGFWYAHWTPQTTFLDGLEAWGYQRTYSQAYPHLDGQLFVYRYDRADLIRQEVTRFGEVLRLHRASYPAHLERGARAFNVNLLWSTAAPLPTDYTVSVFWLAEDGALGGQQDNYPQEGTRPTSTWPSDALLFDSYLLPAPPQRGDYVLGLKVYNGMDGSLLRPLTGGDFWQIGTLEVRE
jgi:hypothetical protein